MEYLEIAEANVEAIIKLMVKHYQLENEYICKPNVLLASINSFPNSNCFSRSDNTIYLKKEKVANGNTIGEEVNHFF